MIDPIYCETLFNYLYSEIDGYSVSHAAREVHNKSEVTENFLYGELPFKTWKEIVERANPKKDGVFFDLGSGTGRVVISSHMLFNFKKSIGVELLKGLHDKACEINKIYETEVKPRILEYVENRELQFLNKDIFDIDLREADFILMNHPFKDNGLFDNLEAKMIKELKSGSKIVTTIRALKNPAFKQLGSKKYNFSWGESTAYFHEIV